eukprot:g4326.t1
MANPGHNGLFVSVPRDGGSIDVVTDQPPQLLGVRDTTGAAGAELRVRLRSDPVCETEGALFRQWFYFRVSGLRRFAPGSVRVRFVGAVRDSMCGAGAFDGYRACASFDLRTWLRVAATCRDGDDIVVTVPASPGPPACRPQADAVFMSYFVPFSIEAHAALLARCTAAGARLTPLITTPGGHTLDRLSFCPLVPATGAAGAAAACTDERPLQVWLLARQHPSETAAAWWMSGLLSALCEAIEVGGGGQGRGACDATEGEGEGAGEGEGKSEGVKSGARSSAAAEVLARCEVHVVPNMNPDGSAAGHTRTNAAGLNLNRMWAEPEAAAPEVRAVRDAMDGTGCDLLVDVHQDETLDTAAIACCTPAWTPRLERLQLAFAAALEARAGPLFDRGASEQFLLRRGAKRASTDDSSAGGRMDNMGEDGANMTLATTQAGARYGCLAVTLEQPFKPVAAALAGAGAAAGCGHQGGGGEGARGAEWRGEWDEECSRRLGASTVGAIADVLGMLRAT